MADNDNHDTIDALQWEKRKFPPSEAFKKNTLVAGTFLYDEANEDYEAFWARQASELVSWDTQWDTICEWNLPYSKWFVGGKLNVSYNCLDRHVIAGKGDKVAFHFEAARKRRPRNRPSHADGCAQVLWSKELIERPSLAHAEPSQEGSVWVESIESLH